MSQKKRLMIVALIFVVFLLLLIWLLIFLLSDNEKEVSIQENQQIEEVEEVIPARPTISEQELEEERETRTTSADVVSLSKTFVVRYGSYSNEANFANLEDVLPLTSVEFARELQRVIDVGVAPDGYYGISTSIVTVTVDQKDEIAGTAQVTVTTQREEAVGSTQNVTVKYQDIVLTFVKEQDTWKIDSATWQ